MDKINELAIEVLADNDGENPKRGSGFPVGRGLVMTCAHAIRDRSSAWVRWSNHPEADIPKDIETRTYEGSIFTQAKVLFCGESDDIDIALLKTFHPPDLGHFLMSTLDGELGDGVCGIGFPAATKSGTFRSVPLNGEVTRAPCLDTLELLQIRLYDSANQPEDWRGASGAPVVLKLNLHVAGVFQLTDEYLRDANIVWAIPARTIRNHPEVGKIIQESACDPKETERARMDHKREFKDLIADQLFDLDRRDLDHLMRRLGLEASADDDGNIEDCTHHLTEHAESSLERLSRLRSANEVRASHQVWCELIRLVAASMLDEDEVGILALARLEVFPEEHAPGNPASLELRAAQIDGRRIDYLDERSSEAAMPVGRKALNVMAAEKGPGHDTDPAALEHDLLARGGLRIGTNVEHVLKDYLSREPLLTGARKHPLSEDDRRELAGVFRRARLVPGNATYYMPHLIRLPTENQEQANRIAKYFRNNYPGVMVIPVDRAKWDLDADRYANVVSTVPVRRNTRR